MHKELGGGERNTQSLTLIPTSLQNTISQGTADFRLEGTSLFGQHLGAL